MIRDLRSACEKMTGPGAWSLCDQSGRGEVGAPHHCIQLPQEVCRKLLSKPTFHISHSRLKRSLLAARCLQTLKLLIGKKLGPLVVREPSGIAADGAALCFSVLHPFHKVRVHFCTVSAQILPSASINLVDQSAC